MLTPDEKRELDSINLQIDRLQEHQAHIAEQWFYNDQRAETLEIMAQVDKLKLRRATIWNGQNGYQLALL